MKKIKLQQISEKSDKEVGDALIKVISDVERYITLTEYEKLVVHKAVDICRRTTLENKSLPCNIGDTLYFLSPFRTAVYTGTVDAIKVSRFGYDLDLCIGAGAVAKKEFEKCFLTKEDAMNALVDDKPKQNNKVSPATKEFLMKRFNTRR